MNTTRIAIVIASLVFAASCGVDDAADKGAVLNRGLVTDPESLDPHKARTTQAAEVQRDIGEGLIGYTSTGELIARVAETWIISEDGRTYTFHLRPDAKWSNGDAVVASDFVVSLRRLVTPKTAAFYAQAVEEIINATEITAGDKAPSTLGVRAVDELTLVITLERPTPYMLGLLTHPSTFPIHVPSYEEHKDSFARPGKLVSNGAYRLDSWIPGSVVTLKRNEHYWDNESTAIDEIRYHVMTQEAAEFARYRAGEIHITSSVPPDNIEQARTELPDQLHVSTYLGVYYYGYNLTKPPFKDNLQLRQALSMAIDREQLVEHATKRGEEPAYSWVPPGIINYEPRVFSYATLTQDERHRLAQSFYKEAGYSEANPLKFELRYNTSDTHRRVAVAIQDMWREVLGAEVTLINEELQVLNDNVGRREITQMFRSSWVGDYNDANTFLSLLQTGHSSNTTAYSNEGYDVLLRQAAGQVDLDRRRLFLEEAEREMLADHPLIPIYFYVSKHLVSPGVEGWGDNILDYHYSQHLSFKTAK